MTHVMNRFRRIVRKSTLIKDDRGLSTVEYVIILVLIAAAAVGVWSTLGSTITKKVGEAQGEIETNVVIEKDGAGKDPS